MFRRHTHKKNKTERRESTRWAYCGSLGTRGLAKSVHFFNYVIYMHLALYNYISYYYLKFLQTVRDVFMALALSDVWN